MKQSELEQKVAKLEQSIIEIKSLFVDTVSLHKEASEQRNQLALAIQHISQGCLMIAQRIVEIESKLSDMKPLDLSTMFENRN